MEPLCFTRLTSWVSGQPRGSWGQISVQSSDVAQDRLLEFNKYWLMVTETVSLFLDMLSLCLQEATDSQCCAGQFPWQQKLSASKLETTQSHGTTLLWISHHSWLFVLSWHKEQTDFVQCVCNVNRKTMWRLCPLLWDYNLLKEVQILGVGEIEACILSHLSVSVYRQKNIFGLLGLRLGKHMYSLSLNTLFFCLEILLDRIWNIL